MAEMATRSIASAVDEAISQLVRTEHFVAASVATLPILYPSGASVQVEISLQGDRCFVTDGGGAHQEAEMMGTLRYFAREASRIAAEAGIRFDGHDLFIAEVPLVSVGAAMVAVGNCSQLASAFSVQRAAQREAADRGDELYRRLRELLPTKDVAREAELRGASSHPWSIDVLVRGDTAPAAFEVVAKQHISVVNTAAKFGDLVRLELPPRTISVVRNRREFGDLIGVLSGVSTSVIETSANDATLLKVAA